MIRILATALLAISLTASGAFALSIDDLVYVDGAIHKKFTDVPFTGKVDEGQARGGIKNGIAKGPWVLYYENGRLWSKGAYKNGKEEGPWVWYNSDGTKVEAWTGTFRNGEKVSD
jgi:antitoxin component YwqK of YwqJK toxin-antitoxin module